MDGCVRRESRDGRDGDASHLFSCRKAAGFRDPVLARGVTFYQLADHDLPILPGTPFDKRIRAGLAEPLPGGNWVMHIKGRQIPTNLVQRYDLEVDHSYPCITLAGAVFCRRRGLPASQLTGVRSTRPTVSPCVALSSAFSVGKR